MKPEILSPGGSFNSALKAVQGGADAVYLGLKQFSARKGAANFTPNGIRRLRTAVGPEKKIYLAINTVIIEKDLPLLKNTLSAIKSGLPIDALILQDWGLFHLIKKIGLDLPLHGSTQMAVHNAEGALFLQSLGFKRVVLSRELNYREIEAIRTQVPQLELEVFIQGALCYAFSGLCLASGLLLGRSANKGDCGQICRTWFEKGSQKGYFFSAKDLSRGSEIQKLQQIGVHSLKIEGRMKSPEYAYFSAAYYRAILEGKKSEIQKSFFEKMIRAFSRESTTQFTEKNKTIPMTTPRFPGHQGELAGEVISVQGNRFQMTNQGGLAQRDGLLVFDMGGISPPIRFSLKWDKSRKWIVAPKSLHLQAQVYRISSSSEKLKEEKEQSFLQAKSPIDVEAYYKKGILSLKSMGFEKTFPILLELSTSDGDFTEALRKHLKGSADSIFKLGSILFRSQDHRKNYFAPPSQLKLLGKEFFADIEKEFKVTLPMVSPRKISNLWNNWRRSAIKEKTTGLPFYTAPKYLEHNQLYQFEDYYCLALAPIQWPQSDFFSELQHWVNKKRDKKILIGLNNPAHLWWALKQKENQQIYFFIDYGLYSANSYTVDFFQTLLGKQLLFTLAYIENPDEGLQDLQLKANTDFKPPLFISRICQLKEGNQGICQNKCNRRGRLTFKQQRKEHLLIIEDCINYLF